MISPLSFIVLPSRVILGLSKASSEYGHCDRDCPKSTSLLKRFRLPSEKQEKVADEATAALLTKLPGNSALKKRRRHWAKRYRSKSDSNDFAGVDFTVR
jgi:hypothetical protein